MNCIPVSTGALKRHGFEAHRVLYSSETVLALGPQMTPVRYMTLVAALLLTAVGSPLHSDEQEPLTTPTRDVDITYQITRPGQPAIVERRRWLASQQLRRVDGSDNSATIFDQKTGEFTLLNTANHTYRTLETPSGCPRKKGPP